MLSAELGDFSEPAAVKFPSASVAHEAFGHFAHGHEAVSRPPSALQSLQTLKNPLQKYFFFSKVLHIEKIKNIHLEE
jgi:hypothetical protein